MPQEAQGLDLNLLERSVRGRLGGGLTEPAATSGAMPGLQDSDPEEELPGLDLDVLEESVSKRRRQRLEGGLEAIQPTARSSTALTTETPPAAEEPPSLTAPTTPDLPLPRELSRLKRLSATGDPTARQEFFSIPPEELQEKRVEEARRRGIIDLPLAEELKRGVQRFPGQFVESFGGAVQAAANADIGEKLEETGLALGGPDTEQRMIEGVERVAGFLSGEDVDFDVPTPEEREALAESAGESLVGTGREMQEDVPPSPSVRHGGVFQPENPRWWLARGPEVVAQLGTQVAFARLTGGGVPAFAVPIGIQEGGHAYLDTKRKLVERGVEEEAAEREASANAALTATGSLVLEGIPGAVLLLDRVPGARGVLGRALTNRIGDAGSRAVAASGTESVTEIAQEAWSDVVAHARETDPDAFADWANRYGAAGTLGAFGGGVVGAGLGALETPSREEPAGPVASTQPPPRASEAEGGLERATEPTREPREGERVVAATIRDPKTGKTYRAPTHAQAIERAADDGASWSQVQQGWDEGDPEVVGFATTERDHVSRDEAIRVAGMDPETTGGRADELLGHGPSRADREEGGAPESLGEEAPPEAESGAETSERLSVRELREQGRGEEAVAQRAEIERKLRIAFGGETEAEPASLEAPEATSEVPLREPVERTEGAETTVLPASGDELPARYAIVDAATAPPSHDPVTFQRESEFPEGIQERRYHANPVAQDEVTQRAKELDPRRLLDRTPSPTEGPPIVRPDGVRLSGNQRGMLVMRANEQHPERFQAYTDALVTEAEEFGIPQEEARARVEAILEEGGTPELVRVLEGEAGEATDPGELAEMMSAFNEPTTKARDPLADAATRARRLVETGGEALEHFSETIEPDQTVRNYLSTAAGRDFVQKLVADGVIPRQEAARYIDRRTGLMNDEGRTLVERTMLAAAVQDPDVVDRAPKSWLRQIEKAIPAIVRAGRVEGWDIAPVLREALDLGAVARAEGMNVGDVAAQTDLTGRQWSEDATTVARFLEEHGPLATAKAFRQYAQDAVGSQNLELFGSVPRNPAASLRARFGGEETDGPTQGLRGPESGGMAQGLLGGRTETPTILRKLRGLFGGTAEPDVPRIMTEQEAAARPDPGTGTDVPFRRQETEERFQAAREGVGRTTIIERVREALTESKQYFRRRFRHLPSGERFEPARFALLQLEKQWDLATERTVRDRLEPILEGLSPADYELFTRKVILDDLQHETETNQLPYGFESIEEVEQELERVNERVANNPTVEAAVERRQEVWSNLKESYIEAMDAIGFDAAKRLTREDYFHHQILHYAKLKREAGEELGKLRGPKRLRTPTYRGFLRQREGSELDINANYLEAEPEVMAMMDYDTQVARTLAKIRETYDRGPGLRADLRSIQDGQTELFEEYEIPEGTDPATLTVADIAPDDYVEWHPKPGGTFYLAYSIPERVAMKVFEGVADDIGLTDDLVRQVVAKGSEQPLIIPEQLARTLDDLPGGPASNLAADMSRKGHSAWKQLQLISPRRFGRYNIRNLTGDAEAMFLGNRSAFKQSPEAGVELYQVMFQDAPMSEPFKAWYERGGMQTLLQVQEMGDIKELEQFVRFHEQNPDRPGLIHRAWNKYWRGARRSTDWREAMLRYAAFLDYRAQMEADPEGRPDSFGGSIPEEVMALEDLDDRAFKLSNELLGAYDQISVGGEVLRQHVYPFWSFQEINVRRYWRFFKNAARDDRLAAEVGKTVLTKAPSVSFSLAARVGKFALLSTAFYGLLSAWNHLLFPEEEEALDPDVQGRPHIVLGRDEETGEIIAFTRLGIFGDLLEWFTPDDLPYQVGDWAKGRRTLTEIAFDMLVKAPINKLAGGLGPVYNYPYTLLSGKELWPEALDGRPVRDKAEWVARSLTLSDEYKALLGKPSRPYSESWDDLLTYRYDPREQAYWRTRDRVREFREELGDVGGGVFMSPRSNALWNLKRALRYEDDTAYRKYLLEYYHLGGTEGGLEQSLEALHPLRGLSDEEQERFRATYLDAAGQKRLQQAIDYYQDLLEGTPISEDRPQPRDARRLSGPRRRAPRIRRLRGRQRVRTPQADGAYP